MDLSKLAHHQTISSNLINPAKTIRVPVVKNDANTNRIEGPRAGRGHHGEHEPRVVTAASVITDSTANHTHAPLCSKPKPVPKDHFTPIRGVGALLFTACSVMGLLHWSARQFKFISDHRVFQTGVRCLSLCYFNMELVAPLYNSMFLFFVTTFLLFF